LVLQIEPREVEIGEMHETIRAMDAELERYHKSNAGLDLTIQVNNSDTLAPLHGAAWCRLCGVVLALEQDRPCTSTARKAIGSRCTNCAAALPVPVLVPVQKLHLKETGLQSEVTAQRGGRADAQSQVRKLQCDIAELADAIQDPKALKEKVSAGVAEWGGVMWCGVVGWGGVRCDVVWCGALRCGVMWCGVVLVDSADRLGQQKRAGLHLPIFTQAARMYEQSTSRQVACRRSLRDSACCAGLQVKALYQCHCGDTNDTLGGNGSRTLQHSGREDGCVLTASCNTLPAAKYRPLCMCTS
jgi:hypothetical protein